MSEQDAPDQSMMPPWRETFLARYPRYAKIGATFVILFFVIGPPLWIHIRLHRHDGNVVLNKEAVEDKDKPAEVPPVVASDVNAPALNDQDDRSVKLAPAPDPRVTEETAEGTLPRISEDGLRPWQVYARPFDAADKRPRVAIVVADLGLSRQITDAAIAQLPPTVTLSFESQGPAVAAWSERARQDGHEIILQVPMEPFDYPRSDPGPATLLTSLPNSDNLARLITALGRATGYVGITSLSGSRFTSDAGKYAPVLDLLRARGLLVLDAHVAPHSVVGDMAREAGVPVAVATEHIDSDLSPDALAEALNDLEKTARQNGRAIGILSPTPLVLAQLEAWAKTLPQRGIALAPLSAMVQQ